MAADPRGQGIRRRSGGRPNVYGTAMYAMNGGQAVSCPSFDPADGDPGSCASCGHYDSDHHESALGLYAGSVAADQAWYDQFYRGIPGSDSSTGAH